MLTTLLLAVVVIAGFFALMSIGLLLKKEGGELKGTCGSLSRELGEKGVSCACGKEPGTCEEAQNNSQNPSAMPQVGTTK